MALSAFQAAVYGGALRAATAGGGGEGGGGEGGGGEGGGGVDLEVRLGGLPGTSATAQPQSFMLAFLVTMALLYAPVYIAEVIRDP